MKCKKCGMLLATYEELRGFCSNCVGVRAMVQINVLEEMIEEYNHAKKIHEAGINIADKKIAFFTGLIQQLKAIRESGD